MLGIEIDAMTMDELNALVLDSVRSADRRIIANHNLHSVYLFHNDYQMREFYGRAHRTHIDGMSLVYLSRLFGYPVRRENRVTYLDWIMPLMTECARHGWKVFYLGGKPGVAAAAARCLKRSYPELQLETHDGFFNALNHENDNVLDQIRSFRPNILMVGMGMPLQEHWILDNFSRIKANVILPAGACFDYISGAIPSPSRWLGRIGLEWLYRLASEPGRLWRRYLIEPWYLLGLVIKELRWW
jgi:N-acetylglucosaminyldiphosphoundecaprenol N-acetyl-beta-D-mannosaminyltransferase